MGLESATYIDDLTASNPVSGDTVAQGDDHIRLLKSVLKATFPNLAAPRYLEQARADVASASAPDIWAAASNYVNITGTTTITDFADADFSGQMKLVRFDDALTLTHGATEINLPSGANITTAAGDHALFVAQGTTQFNCVYYLRKSGRAIIEADDELPTQTGADDGLFLQADGAGGVSYELALPDQSGNSGLFLTTDGTDASWVAAETVLIGILEDQKTSGTDGGTFSSGADRTRTLNTEVYNRDSTITLSSNQFTLPAGTWFIKWEAPVGFHSSAAGHQSFLYNFTDSSEVKRGSSGRIDGGDFSSVWNYLSKGSAVVTIADAKAFEIRHRISETVSGSGFGSSGGHGTEVYTRVEIFRI